MKNKKFDQELKSELEHYDSSADPAAIWAAIESEVDQINEEAEEENKWPLAWIFSLLSIGLLMVLAIAWTLHTDQLEPSLVGNLNNEIQTIDSAEPREQSSLPIHNSKDFNITEKKNNNIVLPKSVSISPISNFEKSKLALVVEKNEKPTLFMPPIQPQSSTSNQSGQINNENKSTFEQSLTSLKSALNISKKSNNIFLKESQSLPLEKEQTLKKYFLTPMVLITNDRQIDYPSIDLERIITPAIVTIPSLADRRRRRSMPPWSIGLELQGGAALTNRKLSLSNGGNSDYLNLRETTESALETVQTGLKIELQHRTGFSFSTGIQWSRITERYTIEEKTIEEKLENTLISYSINMNQDTVNRTYNDIPRTTTTTTTREGFNRYELLDIPLLVGYHFKKRKLVPGIRNWNTSQPKFIYQRICVW